MDGKIFLNEVRGAKMEAKRLQEEYNALKRDLSSIKVSKLDAINRMHTNTSPVEKIVFTYLERESELLAKIEALFSLQKEAECLINKIEPSKNSEVYKQILLRYYIGGDSFQKISQELHFSYWYLHRLHGHALNDFRRVYRQQKATYHK